MSKIFDECNIHSDIVMSTRSRLQYVEVLTGARVMER